MATITEYKNGHGTWFDVEPNTNCWLWLRSCNHKGYGLAWIDGDKYYAAPRLFYTIFIGPIPKGKIVMHKCDVPQCVNPDHLEVGTQSKNICDAFLRGRKIPVYGEANGQSKLSDKQVTTIRKLYNDGKTQAYIASVYHVTQSTVSLIVNNKRRVRQSPGKTTLRSQRL